MAQALAKAESAKTEFEQARSAVEHGVKAERDKREAWRAAGSALDVARRALQNFERKQAEQTAQTSALDEAQRRTDAQLQEANQQCAAVELEFAALPALDGLSTEVSNACATRSTVNVPLMVKRGRGMTALSAKPRCGLIGLVPSIRKRSSGSTGLPRRKEQSGGADGTGCRRRCNTF